MAMKKEIKALFVGLGIFLMVFLFGCAQAPQPAGESVEVSPGKFIVISRVDRSHDDNAGLSGSAWTGLSIPWEGTNITWRSHEIPVCLRAHDGKLYMIGFDRDTDFSKPRFKYFAQKGGILKEVPPSEYPKQIASQNMWFGDRYLVDLVGNTIDEVQLARDLDPENGHFRRSLTAQIWYHLETGKDYFETEGKRLEKLVLAAYVAAHNPIALPTIVKDDQD
jgi:hypothetical protein